MAHRRVPARLAGALVGLALGLGPAAFADDDGGDDHNSGNDYGQCKYVCPTFENSPVIICLPQSECRFDEPRDGERQR
jgi:hypothetical protein